MAQPTKKSPFLEVAAVILVLLAIGVFGWRTTAAMGRIEGSGSNVSWSLIGGAIVSLLLVGLLLARFLSRGRGSGEGNRTTAYAAIMLSVIVLLLAMFSTPDGA